MIRTISSALLTLAFASSAWGADAAYNCQVQPKDQAAEKTSFSFDTATEANKFVALEGDVGVGCIVLRSDPAYLTCAIGSSEADASAATVVLGTPVLGLQAPAKSVVYSLNCKKL